MSSALSREEVVEASTGRPLARTLRGLRALVPLGAAWGAGLLLLLALMLELQWHRSKVLAMLSALPAVWLAAWFSKWLEGGWTRTAVRWAAVRGVLLLLLLLVLLLLLDHQHKDRGAWGIWIPAMTLDFIPSMMVALPWVVIGCAAGLATSYWFLVVRRRRAPFVVAFVWPVIWAYLAFNGFYRVSFGHADPRKIAAQPGVTILAENHQLSCTLWQKHCTARLFPRGLSLDAATRTLYATFGSTTSLHRQDPKLLAVPLDGSEPAWLPGTTDANQLRNLDIDSAQRILAFSQWGSRRVSIYNLDTRRPLREIPYPLQKNDGYEPFNVLIDGKYIVVFEIWYPRVVVYDWRAGKLVRYVDLYDAGLIGNGVQLVGGALSRHRGKIWVGLAQPGANVLELDLATLKPLREVDLDTTFPASFTYDDEQGRIYTTSFRSSAIEVVDVDKMKKVDEISGVIGARDTLVDAKHGYLFISDYLKGRLDFYSFSRRTITRRVNVGPKPAAAVVYGDKVYVNSGVGIVGIRLH